MRYIITAVAAVAVSGLLASTALRAEPLYNAGGPARVGNLCSHPNNDNDGMTGYLAPCPKAAKSAKITKKKAKRS